MSDGAYDIILGDEQTVLTDSLQVVLSQFGHTVVAAAASADDLLPLVAEHRPQLCVFDVVLRHHDRTGLLTQLSVASPDTALIVLTADPDLVAMKSALAAGAGGYVHKSRNLGKLLDVITRVMLGEIVVEGFFVGSSGQPEPSTPDTRPHVRIMATYLTPREREVLELLTSGRDTASIAAQLGVSVTTVRTHVQAVLSKLGVHSRLEAASVAARYGLLDDISDVSPRAVGPR